MWRLLRNRRLADFKFRRQVPFEGYILDFACFDIKLVVEVDGSQHADAARDLRRDTALQQAGFVVLRYWNNDVLRQPQSVLEDVFTRASQRR